MSVSNGQQGNETVLNAAFASKTVANTLTGIQGLANVDAASGTAVTNLQRQHNSIASFVGAALNGVFDLVPTWASDLIGAANETIKARIESIVTHITARSDFWVEYQGIEILGANGSSYDISTEMAGRVADGTNTAVGVITGTPGNRVEVRSSLTNGGIFGANDLLIFGRITHAAGVWTLSFQTLDNGVELSHNLASQDILIYFRESFDGTTRDPTASEEPGILFGAGGTGGGVGGVNLFPNPDAESGVLDWDVYADAAGNTPVDGSGGSPNITWTRDDDYPARGGAAFLLTKDASNRQGQGVSSPFNLDQADPDHTIMIAFNAKRVNGDVGYADGDLSIQLLVDGVIQPALNAPIIGLSTDHFTRHVAYFKVDEFGSACRPCIHVTSNNAAAYGVLFDDFTFTPIPDGSYPPIEHSRASPTTVDAAGGIVLYAHPAKQVHFIQGDSAVVDVSANPQITAGEVVGQELRLIGRSDSLVVYLEDGTGLSLNGPWNGGADSVLDLMWDGTNWLETSRR